MSHREFQSCIDACVQCAQECEHCAEACLSEKGMTELARCVRLDKDCAQICWTAAAYMSRGSEVSGGVCGLCAEICDACAEECERHSYDHCKSCAKACQQCAKECRKMAGAAV